MNTHLVFRFRKFIVFKLIILISTHTYAHTCLVIESSWKQILKECLTLKSFKGKTTSIIYTDEYGNERKYKTKKYITTQHK